MMEYFNYYKSKYHIDHADKSSAPVLTDEDEAFLQRIASEGTPPPLPSRPRPQSLPEAGSTSGNDAQIVLMHGAQDIPLPDVPDTPDEISREIGFEGEDSGKGKGKETEKETPKEKDHDGKGRKVWSFLRRDSRDAKRKHQAAAGADLHSVAEGLKAADAVPNEDGVVSDPEAKKEEEEMTVVLEQLNLAAVNNRVFSISKESQELLRKFTLVLKDLLNGVPTAYSDLEFLLAHSDKHLQKAYSSLPSFLQKLIESLPSKLTGSLGPEILAAAAEKQGIKSEYLTKSAGLAEKMGVKVRVPNLKDLVTKPGAVATLLRSIMNFLKLRFPAFAGMNVLWSLALFVLLFVFWYCHKRGREVRLEKERLLTEAEMAALDHQIRNEPPADYHPSSSAHSDPAVPTASRSDVPMTTAPEGASMEEVHAGMLESQAVRAAEASESGGMLPGSTHVDGTVEGRGYAPGGSLAKDEERREREAREKEGSEPAPAPTS
ncbi:hypothetical protein MMC30_008209 [Trapelia coarctata]|nr:hypothetical protein [Trapelia coarctata]